MVFLGHNVNFRTCMRLYSMTSSMNIRTFVFLDLETTGLPYYENNRTRITELCITVVESEHISLGVFPRVQNKLALTFNPRKLIDKQASDITGLSNELLEFQSEFQASTVSLINQFFSLQQQPLCLVAHNGNRFDFPIFKSEISRTGCDLNCDILCIDSLQAFRQLHQEFLRARDDDLILESRCHSTETIPVELQDEYDALLLSAVESVEEFERNKKFVSGVKKCNETTPKKQIIQTENAVRKTASKKLKFGNLSFKLIDVYERLTSKTAVDQHRAECDVSMLIECAATLGENFVNWANKNAKKFSDVAAMKPGKPIGT